MMELVKYFSQESRFQSCGMNLLMNVDQLPRAAQVPSLLSPVVAPEKRLPGGVVASLAIPSPQLGRFVWDDNKRFFSDATKYHPSNPLFGASLDPYVCSQISGRHENRPNLLGWGGFFSYLLGTNLFELSGEFL
jgi:hypothetical protein